MSFYYQSGEGLNLLARAAAVKAPAVSGGTIDTNYPLANLYDGRPSKYLRYSTPAANETITFDLNLLQAGDAEIDFDSSWVSYSDTGTPAFSRSVTTPYSGTYSHRFQLTAGAPGDHYCGQYRDVLCRAGEKLRIYHAGKAAASGTTYIRIENLETGLFLQSDGAWGGGAASVGTHVTSSWTSGYVNFVVPGAEAGGGLWQRLRVYLQGNVTGAAEIDAGVEAKLVPGWDTIVLVGHVNTPKVPVAFEYAALTGNDPRDSWAGAANVSDWLKTTPDASKVFPADEFDLPALWNKAQATRYERWVRFYLTGTNYNPTSAAGELLLVQAETLPRAPRLQVSDMHEATGQIRQESGAGDPWIHNRSPYPRPRITLRYQTGPDSSAVMPGPSADERTIRRMFSGRTHAGRYPVLVLPYGTHDSRAVIYGTTLGVFQTEHLPPERLMEVEVQAYPIPGLHHALGTV